MPIYTQAEDYVGKLYMPPQGSVTKKKSEIPFATKYKQTWEANCSLALEVVWYTKAFCVPWTSSKASIQLLFF